MVTNGLASDENITCHLSLETCILCIGCCCVVL